MWRADRQQNVDLLTLRIRAPKPTSAATEPTRVRLRGGFGVRFKPADWCLLPAFGGREGEEGRQRR